MIKNRTRLTIVLGGIAALLVVAFLTVSVITHTAASAQTPSTPTGVVKIVQTGNDIDFTPDHITTGKVAGQSTIKIINKTKVGQTIMLNGQAKVSIPPAESRLLAIGEGTFAFSLKSHPKVKLTVVGE